MNVSSNTQKYYAGVQNACLQCVERQGAFQTFESFFSLPKILFLKIFKSTQTLKTVQKVFLIIFEINLKII